MKGATITGCDIQKREDREEVQLGERRRKIEWECKAV
jgi:hypothetical protein